MFVFNQMSITAETTAAQIAAALGCDHVTLDSTYELFFKESSGAGFAVAGIGTTNLMFYNFFNNTVSTTKAVMEIAGTLYYFKRDDNIILMTSSSGPKVNIAMVKGVNPQDGSVMWGYMSLLQGNTTSSTENGYLFDKLSTAPFNIGSSFVKKILATVGATTVVMCPLFNVNTGFFSTSKAYFAACIPASFGHYAYDTMIGDKEYLLFFPGTSSSDFAPIVFDVSS